MTTRNEDGSWSAWDQARAIDVHIVSVSGRADGSTISAEAMLGASPSVAGHGWVGTWGTLVEEGVHRFAIAAAATNTLMSCWISSSDGSDEAWARTVLDSIHFT